MKKFKIFLAFIAFLFVLAILKGMGVDLTGSDKNDFANDPAAKSAAAWSTGVPTKNPTPRPTATPKPTATPMPDYASMKIEDAAHLICESASDGVCILRSIEIDPEVVFIDAEFGRAYKDQSRLIGAVRYTIRIAQEIFAHKDAPMIYLRFHESGRDQYGNQVDMTTITIRLKRETAAKMNLPYMLDSAARTQKLFLDAADGYSLHKDYKGILK